MKPALALGALLIAAATGDAGAGGDSPPDGAALHQQYCTRCHGAEVYTRAQRMVQDLAALRAQVRQCELLAEAGWFEEEVEAVVGYLNGRYYRFIE